MNVIDETLEQTEMGNTSKDSIHRSMAPLLKSIFYSGRLSNKKPCLLLTVFLFMMAKSYHDAIPSFPRWQRIGRLIANVDHYSKYLSREVIESDHRFKEFTDLLAKRKEPPYLLYLDKGHLDISLNHICNLEYMSDSMPRLAVVSFDREVEKQFNKYHPYIPTVTLDFSLIRKSIPDDLENRRYVVYQLVLMLRSHIAAVLSSRGISFWSMQQDSIWTENFVSMEVEKHYPNALLIFDTVGNDQFTVYERSMPGWICGATFFVRASPITVDFFKKVALLISRRQSPESSIMTYLCGAQRFKCVKMPRWLASSSDFFMGDRNVIPIIVQIDHETKMSKMELFKRENFIFINNDGTCNASAVLRVKESIMSAFSEIRRKSIDHIETSSFYDLLWSLHHWLGFDSYYSKRFLRVHESLL